MSETVEFKVDLSPVEVVEVIAGPPGPPGPPGQDATLPQTATQAEMEAGTETALRSLSPKLVADAISALAPSGGGGIWEKVGKITVSIAGTTTLEFTGLDGDLYDYRLEFFIQPLGLPAFLYINSAYPDATNKMLQSVKNGIFTYHDGSGPDPLTDYSGTQRDGLFGFVDLKTYFNASGQRVLALETFRGGAPYGLNKLVRSVWMGWPYTNKITAVSVTTPPDGMAVGTEVAMYRKAKA